MIISVLCFWKTLLASLLFATISASSASLLFSQQPIAQPIPDYGFGIPADLAQPGVYFSSNASSDSCGSSTCDSDNCSTALGGVLGRSLLGGGLIKKSDHCFDEFISPMTNPIFFQDPRQTTEARPIYVHHKVPLAAGGGEVNLYAVQLRARLSENVSLIATKDGYFTSSNPLIDDGWADLAAGLKFTLMRDVAAQRLLAAGFTYEMPTGEASALQGNGDGELHVFSSYAARLAGRFNFISGGGLRQPMNTTDESTSIYWSNHLSTKVRRGVYLLGETNWYNWTQSGVDGPLPGIEGLDVINLGSPNVAGNNIVTQAFGVKLKPNRNNEIGFAFEVPLTERRDIIDNRITADWIIRY